VSNPFVDAALGWIGQGPGLPRICLPFERSRTRTKKFADAVGSALGSALGIQTILGDFVRAPTNGLLWHVPNPSAATTAPSILESWPRLRNLDGSAFGRDQLAENDALLEVWPAAFRRLEYVFGSLEVPAGAVDWDLPQMPTPRWFWIRGLGGMVTHAQLIAQAQFPGHPAPGLDRFFAGQTPLLVKAGDLLAVAEEEIFEIRAFDMNGLPIDPDWVFATFEAIAQDSTFGNLRTWGSEMSTWQAPARHVLVFCDGAGVPYVSRADPDEPPPSPSFPSIGIPPRELVISGPTQATLAIPENGVLVLDDAHPTYAELRDELPLLELAGTHQRLTLAPHGTLAKQIRASFGSHTFIRAVVQDFAQWFPLSANPRNVTAGADAFARYTDGNEVIPLIDGEVMLREIYRAMRATYVDETYDTIDAVPALDPSAIVTTAPPELKSKAMILLADAWIHAYAPLLGRRAMLKAPRTQPDAHVDVAELVRELRPIASFPIPTPLSEENDDYTLWWLASTTPLPPGAAVEVRQLTFMTAIYGDDPRVPGLEDSRDLFGITSPLSDSAAMTRVFVGTDGLVVFPALFKAGEQPRAHVRVITWTADESDPDPLNTASSGKGRKRIFASGEVVLPAPDDPVAAPAVGRPDVNPSLGMRLDVPSPGRAEVVLDAGTVTGPDVPIIVVNSRTGEVIALAAASTTGEIRIPVEPFALRDQVLVGFPTGPELAPKSCAAFFVLQVSEAQFYAGAATGHGTEVSGIVREAIDAGVEAKLLAWHMIDQLAQDVIFDGPGMVSHMNSGAPRGQAILDSLVRRVSGVHHQKAAFIRTAKTVANGGGAMAFVGGIDLLSTRWDTSNHDAIEPARSSSPWHDLHCRIRGKAVWDVYRNFRQRWNAALEHPELVGADPGRTPLPPTDDVVRHGPDVVLDPAVTFAGGDFTVQINRTIAPFLDAHSSFVDPEHGDLSVFKAYKRVIREARRFLYIEEQYFWFREIATLIRDALATGRIEFVILLMPRPLRETGAADVVFYAQRRRALNTLFYGTPEPPDPPDPAFDLRDRIAAIHIQNDAADPIYIHCKSIIADDVWMSISSSNMSQRSMTLDSEMGAMSIDRRTRRGGQQAVRDLRVSLMASHLGLTETERALVEDPYKAFRLVKDYLSGKWRGRRNTKIFAYDPAQTHFGRQPSTVDGTSLQAVDLALDQDGRQRGLPGGALDARAIMEALYDESGVGVLGTLSFTFGDLAELPIAMGPLVITVTMSFDQDGAPRRVVLGSFALGNEGQAGIVKVGEQYQLHADVAAESAPSTILSVADASVTAVQGRTQVVITGWHPPP